MVIIISSSGNSRNILESWRWCKKITTINFIRFGRGKLLKLSKLLLILKIKKLFTNKRYVLDVNAYYDALYNKEKFE